MLCPNIVHATRIYMYAYIHLDIHISNYLISCAIRFVLSLENDLTVRAKTTEINVKDFSSGSYATIFGEEVNKYYHILMLICLKSLIEMLMNANQY